LPCCRGQLIHARASTRNVRLNPSVFGVDTFDVQAVADSFSPGLGIMIEPDVWLRRRQVTTWLARFQRAVAAVCVFWSFVCAAAAVAPGSRHSEAGGLVAAVFLLLSAAGCEALGRRYARRGLFISSDGVVVCNLLSTQRVALDDTEQFTPGVRGGMSGPSPMLKCRTRASVGVGGLAIASLSWRYGVALRDLEPACAQLTALLDHVKQASSPESVPSTV
jgi:hypothetical protein